MSLIMAVYEWFIRTDLSPPYDIERIAGYLVIIVITGVITMCPKYIKGLDPSPDDDDDTNDHPPLAL